jgi:hypothetical protein
MRVIYHDVEQNSEEWESLRLGKATASNYAKFMANFGKAFGDPADRYALQLALERVTGRRAEHSFKTDDMERGHEQEPLARLMYEELHFVDVQNGGFFDWGDWGDSPDGLIDDDGTLEIKCVTAAVHEANIRRGKPDPAYKWQIVGHLDGTGREWNDFASYCSDYPEWNQLVVFRTYRHEVSEELAQLAERREQFIELIRTKENEINQRAA